MKSASSIPLTVRLPRTPDAVESCSASTESHCITCGDEAVAMSVVRCGQAGAVCRDDGRALHEVAVDLVAPVAAGDRVLVHAGVAIRRLEAER